MKSRNDSLFDNLNFEDTSSVATEVMDSFEQETYDKVLLIYNHSKIPLPSWSLLTISQIISIESASKQSGDYIYGPSQDTILRELLPKSLKIQLFKALRDSLASEHVKMTNA